MIKEKLLENFKLASDVLQQDIEQVFSLEHSTPTSEDNAYFKLKKLVEKTNELIRFPGKRVEIS
ncbi:MAG: hypothetical protein LRY71_00320 [Bacillaceae bacterium]|nr:hypothetical protein [Bacillaceae bacterium]